jgi:hypothetical protein
MLSVEERSWKMYGLEATERVKSERMIWGEFIEAAR